MVSIAWTPARVAQASAFFGSSAIGWHFHGIRRSISFETRETRNGRSVRTKK